MAEGTLYGIGVGPGDPELVTLKALRIARACPVLAYPAPEEGESLARRIMAPHLGGRQTEIAIRTPMSADRYPANAVYDQASRDIAAHLAGGRDVAMLCVGDPFFYGSFMYVFARVSAAHRTVVVPGVTSLSAAAASLGAPLAARNDVLTVIPALLDDSAITARLADAEAAAIIKLGRHFSRIRALLESIGLIERAHYIEYASFAQERVAPLDAVDPARVPYFSLILLHRRGQAWQ
ncbi:MAG TPA: precorrin-2 C(20)-methyltransferase [Alphaproteobacteria bacterium]|nr:precorrin-2 C(20)-methyltransferase [Alphaproteobacteria bacterium]